MFTIFSLMLSLFNQHMLCNDIIMWVIFSNLGTILSCLQDQATIHAVLCFWVVVWNRMRSLHMDLQWIRSYLNEFQLKKANIFFLFVCYICILVLCEIMYRVIDKSSLTLLKHNDLLTVSLIFHVIFIVLYDSFCCGTE